jgi:hypothetical protein
MEFMYIVFLPSVICVEIQAYCFCFLQLFALKFKRIFCFVQSFALKFKLIVFVSFSYLS